MFESPDLSPLLLGTQTQFEDHRQDGLFRHTPPASIRPMAHGGKSGFDRIGRADVGPVLGRKVVEGQELFPVLLETGCGLGVFGFIGLQKGVESLFRLLAGLGHPDLVKGLLSFFLKRIRNRVENIGCLVDPTALVFHLGEYFFHRSPEAQGSITDRQAGGDKASVQEVLKHILPTLNRLSHPVLDGQKMLLSQRVHTDDHQGAQTLVGSPETAVDAICPEIHPPVPVESPFLPLEILGLPLFLESPDHSGREPFGVRTHQDRQGFRHLSCGNPLQIQPGKCRLHRSGLPDIRRDQSRTKRHRRPGPASHFGNPDRHRSYPCQNFPFRMIPVANDAGLVFRGLKMRKPIQKLRKLRLNGHLDQFSRSGSQQFRQRVFYPFGFRKRQGCCILSMVACLLCLLKCCGVVTTFQQDTPPSSTP